MTPADAAVIIAALIIGHAPELARIIAASVKDGRAAKLKEARKP